MPDSPSRPSLSGAPSGELAQQLLRTSLENWLAAVEERVSLHRELGKGLIRAMEVAIDAWGDDPLPEGLALLARRVISSLPVVFPGPEGEQEFSPGSVRLRKVSGWLAHRSQAWSFRESGSPARSPGDSMAVNLLYGALSSGGIATVEGLLGAPDAPDDAHTRFYWSVSGKGMDQWHRAAGVPEDSSGTKVSLCAVASAIAPMGVRNPLMEEACERIMALSDPLAPIHKGGPPLLAVCTTPSHLNILLVRAMEAGAGREQVLNALISSAGAVPLFDFGEWVSTLAKISPALAKETAQAALAAWLTPDRLPGVMDKSRIEALVGVWHTLAAVGDLDVLSSPVGPKGESAALLLARDVGLAPALEEKEKPRTKFDPSLAWGRLVGEGVHSPGGEVGAMWALWVAQHRNRPQGMPSLLDQVLGGEDDPDQGGQPLPPHLAHFFKPSDLALQLARVAEQMPAQALHGLMALASGRLVPNGLGYDLAPVLDAWARGVVSMQVPQEESERDVFLDGARILCQARLSFPAPLPSDWDLPMALSGIEPSARPPSCADAADRLRVGLDRWRDTDRLPSPVLALLEKAHLKHALPPASPESSRSLRF